MKLARILGVSVLALSLLAGSALAQNHWPKSAPTPEQIKEFISQIESGRITKESLAKFLDGNRIAGYESARRILGDDFISPSDVATAHRVSYTKDQLDYFVKTLPEESVLRWAKENGYAVVAGPPTPTSLLDTRSLNPKLFWTQSGGWYDNENFARNDKAATNWLIIRKEPVPNSTNKNWNEQLQLLSKDEQVPNSGEIGWFITTFYEVRGVRLFERIYVRTSSVASVGGRVGVGGFDGDGLVVGSYWDGGRGYGLGVAASRKF